MKQALTAVLALLAIGIATFAEAQPARRPVKAPRAQRFLLSLNGGVQPGAAALQDRFTFEANVEEATVEVVYPSAGGAMFDGSVGYKLSRHFGIGVAVTRGASETTANISATIPHPFVYERPRHIEGTQSGISRTETAAHVQLLLFLPTRGKLQAVLSGGPSRVSLRHDVVIDVHYGESYPYDTATFSRAATAEFTGSAVGFNVAADVKYMLDRSVGLGGLVRYTQAAIDLDTAPGRTFSIDAGGLQLGAGIRVLF